MFKTLFDFLLNRKGHPVSDAPAKVEAAPAVESHLPKIEPTKCGCGRSSTGYCVGLHKLTSEQWNGHPANPAPVEAVKEEAPKAPAKKAAAKKPAAKKAPAKPRAKKAKE